MSGQALVLSHTIPSGPDANSGALCVRRPIVSVPPDASAPLPCSPFAPLIRSEAAGHRQVARTHGLRETGHYDPKLVDILIARVRQTKKMGCWRPARSSPVRFSERALTPKQTGGARRR